MRLPRLFIGKYTAIRRPVMPIDASLASRIEQARQELVAKGKDVVSVRSRRGHAPPTYGAISC